MSLPIAAFKLNLIRGPIPENPDLNQRTSLLGSLLLEPLLVLISVSERSSSRVLCNNEFIIKIRPSTVVEAEEEAPEGSCFHVW